MVGLLGYFLVQWSFSPIATPMALLLAHEDPGGGVVMGALSFKDISRTGNANDPAEGSVSCFRLAAAVVVSSSSSREHH